VGRVRLIKKASQPVCQLFVENTQITSLGRGKSVHLLDT